MVTVQAVVTVVQTTLSGTVDDFGDAETEALADIFAALLDCVAPECTVTVSVQAGSVVVTATATDTSTDAVTPEAIEQTALQQQLAASDVAQLSGATASSVSTTSTSTQVEQVVSATSPSPPPPPTPPPLEPPLSPAADGFTLSLAPGS